MLQFQSIAEIVKTLQVIMDFYSGESLYLHLYTNTPTLGPGMVEADFEEPTDTGYPTDGIHIVDWTYPFVGTTCASARAATCTFTFDDDPGGETIQGYYVIHVDTGEVWIAADLLAPVVIDTPGQPLSLIPRFEYGHLSVECA